MSHQKPYARICRDSSENPEISGDAGAGIGARQETLELSNATGELRDLYNPSK
jgi:hypothetical protein